MKNKQVKVEVFLDEEVAQWLDIVNQKVGLEDRSKLINQMLHEIKAGSEDS